MHSVMLYKNLVSVDLTELNIDIGSREDKIKSIVNTTELFNNFGIF